MRSKRIGGPAAPRAGWPVELAFVSHGLRLGLRSNRRRLLAALRAIVPPGARPVAGHTVDRWVAVIASPGPAGGTAYSVSGPGVADGQAATQAEAVAAADARLRLHLAEFAPRRVFIHAGVVGWRGRAIVLPGRSFAGKSTLVAALLAAGASYLSDEYAVLDAGGRVHPYARALSLRPPGARRGVRRKAALLGARVARRALPVGLVVVTRYERGARFRPRPLTAGRAALALLDNAIAAQRAPERVWPALRAAVASGRAVYGERGEAGEAARAILALLA